MEAHGNEKAGTLELVVLNSRFSLVPLARKGVAQEAFCVLPDILHRASENDRENELPILFGGGHKTTSGGIGVACFHADTGREGMEKLIAVLYGNGLGTMIGKGRITDPDDLADFSIFPGGVCQLHHVACGRVLSRSR